ncbi:MAG: hypothetical protein B7Z38_07495 [Rhodobacterales bacterium 12-64-8]|nr:MAG: hypothetical protein B7Z38_07495 [Rhodobacterales bacterium 12-64-8]OYX89616.1 MAG: hypothetical protein B7Y84_04465 [Azorhizobium sp. 32-67-21]
MQKLLAFHAKNPVCQLWVVADQIMFEALGTPSHHEVNDYATAVGKMWRVRSRTVFLGPADVCEVVGSDMLAFSDAKAACGPVDLRIDAWSLRQKSNVTLSLHKIQIEGYSIKNEHRLGSEFH